MFNKVAVLLRSSHIALFCLKLDLFRTGGCMKQTYDNGHRKKPNNENRKSISKSVFRLSSARKIVGHLMAHANFVFQAVFRNSKTWKSRYVGISHCQFQNTKFTFIHTYMYNNTLYNIML